MIRRLRLIHSRELTLASLLDELADLPDPAPPSYEPGFVDLDGKPRPEQRTADFYDEVSGMSRFLVEEAGLRRGDRVAICKSNDIRSFRWLLATIRAGGIAVPLSPLLPLAELQAIVARCEPSVMVTDAAVFEGTIGSREALPIPRWVQCASDAPLEGFLRLTSGWLGASPARIAPEDTVAVFHTSGTGGAAKGAMLSSEALLAGRKMGPLFAPIVGRSAPALFALPWAHIMAVSTALYGLLAGIPAYFLPHWETQAAIDAIEQRRITAVVGVPAMFIKLVNSAPRPESLASVRLWVSASDHLPACYRRRLLEYGVLVRGPGGLRAKPLFVNAYGMVELGGAAMFGLAGPFLPGEGELCLAVPPLRVRVVDENGRPARPGVTGECQVRGPGITGRYWGEECAVLTGGWFNTGDLAVRNQLGLVRLTGRAKDVIKCGGYSIAAREIEEALAAHPVVARVAVIGVPHPELGETPLAVIETHPGFTPREEEFREWCRARLAVYKVPRAFRQIDAGSLPQGVTQKVLKRVLRERYAGEFGATQPRPECGGSDRRVPGDSARRW
jgi:long-chain acyl-CoA synthetase